MVLKGKTAIITGASRGIGRAIAERFLKEGAEVFGIARHVVPEAQELGFNYMICDVSKESEVKFVFDYIVSRGNRKIDGSTSLTINPERSRRIDILVNAAGIAEHYAPIFSAEFSEWKRVYETNIFGTFLMMKYAVLQMRENRAGKIINFGAKDGPIPGFSAYNSSKTAIVRLTETAAKEVWNFGIDINIISPGPVKTKLFTDMFLESGEIPPLTVDVEKAVELALFLASEKSNGLSGKFLSAIWDNWQKIPENLPAIMASDAFTLRRKNV